jgi:hypothetical protein
MNQNYSSSTASGATLLVGAVRAAEALDPRVGAPARLEQVMDAPALVLAAEIGAIAAPGKWLR